MKTVKFRLERKIFLKDFFSSLIIIGQNKVSEQQVKKKKRKYLCVFKLCVCVLLPFKHNGYHIDDVSIDWDDYNWFLVFFLYSDRQTWYSALWKSSEKRKSEKKKLGGKKV